MSRNTTRETAPYTITNNATYNTIYKKIRDLNGNMSGYSININFPTISQTQLTNILNIIHMFQY